MTKSLYVAFACIGIFPVPILEEDESLGERIVAFCKANKGKQVGDGECAALAKAALKEVDAKPRSTYPDNPNEGDYVWGKLVYFIEAGPEGKRTGKEKDVRPGDVIQFCNTKFEWRSGGKNRSRTSVKHTAIVAAVEEDGKTWRIFHQNTDGKRFVEEASINLKQLKRGWLRVYRPIPKQDSGS